MSESPSDHGNSPKSGSGNGVFPTRKDAPSDPLDRLKSIDSPVALKPPVSLADLRHRRFESGPFRQVLDPLSRLPEEGRARWDNESEHPNIIEDTLLAAGCSSMEIANKPEEVA